MKRLASLLLLVGALCATGCGGENDEETVKATTETFYIAVARGDAEEACRLLHEDFKTIEGACRDEIDALHENSDSDDPDSAVARFRRASFVKEVRVSGDNATALLGDGKATAELKRENGRWLITMEPLEFGEPFEFDLDAWEKARILCRIYGLKMTAEAVGMPGAGRYRVLSEASQRMYDDEDKAASWLTGCDEGFDLHPQDMRDDGGVSTARRMCRNPDRLRKRAELGRREPLQRVALMTALTAPVSDSQRARFYRACGEQLGTDLP